MYPSRPRLFCIVNYSQTPLRKLNVSCPVSSTQLGCSPNHCLLLSVCNISQAAHVKGLRDLLCNSNLTFLSNVIVFGQKVEIQFHTIRNRDERLSLTGKACQPIEVEGNYFLSLLQCGQKTFMSNIIDYHLILLLQITINLMHFLSSTKMV